MGKIIVKKRVKEFAERHDIERADASDEAFCDLMANIEGEVQNFLEEGLVEGGE